MQSSKCLYCLGRTDTPEPACTCGDTAIDVLLRDGYRRCDIPACNCKSWHRPRPSYNGISVTLRWEENDIYDSYDLAWGPLKFAEVNFSPRGNNWTVYIVTGRHTFEFVGNYNYLEEAKERAEQLVKELSDSLKQNMMQSVL